MSGGGSDFMQVLQNVAPAGKIVAKGEQVAEFDTQYQQTRLDDERTDLEQSERGVRQLEVQLEVSRSQNQFALQQARAVVDKAKLDLKTTPVLSQIQAERMKLQLEEAEAQLKQLLAEEPMRRASEAAEMRQAQIQLATTRTELKEAEANVEKMRIKAPMNGMIVMQKIMAGSEFRQIQQGDQLFPGQMFMQIVDPSSMLVAASVNQTDSEFIRVGAKAHLRFDAYPGLELPGRVISIGAVPRSGGMRGDYMKEIPVYLKIEKMDERVIPDLSVSADVVVASAPDGVIVPLESVFYEDGAEGRPYVYVRTAKGFERRTVELGLKNFVKARVVNGLKAGEPVALEPPPIQQTPKKTASNPSSGSGV
jgi:multidrug efflux pump subunit AcrA (membrane-fusion protein)